MEFSYIADGIDAIIIDDFYNEDQLKEIRNELKFLTKPSILTDDKDKLESATDKNGNYITSKSGVWLDYVFREWSHSSLIRCPMENFSKEEVIEKIVSFNSLFKLFYHCNTRSHLLSYYENSGYYSKHTDLAVFTVLNYFHTEPKQYSGGDITLYSPGDLKKATIESRNNRVVIIPSNIVHEVSTIKTDTKPFSGDGRYCNSIFLTIQPPKETDKK